MDPYHVKLFSDLASTVTSMQTTIIYLKLVGELFPWSDGVKVSKIVINISSNYAWLVHNKPTIVVLV